MATSAASSVVRCLQLLTVAALLAGAAAGGGLSTSFYSKKCPDVQSIVRAGVASAVAAEKRMGASILRMFFHDCFVNVGGRHAALICHQLFPIDACTHALVPNVITDAWERGLCPVVGGFLCFVRTCVICRDVTRPSCWTTRRPSPARRTPGRTPTRCAGTRSSTPSRPGWRRPATPPSPAPTSSRSLPGTLSTLYACTAQCNAFTTIY
jgi:hypothetical protein